MVGKHVQFQMSPNTVHYYQYQSPCDNNQEDSSSQMSSPSLQQQPCQPTNITTIKSNPSPILSKRPPIPLLDFTHLCHHALQPHTTNTDIDTICLSRPLSPPSLSIDTLHYTPVYYTSLSTSYS